MCCDPGSKGAVADKTLPASANTSSSNQESHDAGMYTVCSPRPWVAPLCSKITLCFCAHELETNLLDIWVSKFVICIYRLWIIFVLQCVCIHD